MVKAKPLIDPSKTRLIEELDIFIKQEMQHCKQHINFNKRLHELGYGFLKRSEEHTSELQSLMRISYAVFCLKKKKKKQQKKIQYTISNTNKKRTQYS